MDHTTENRAWMLASIARLMTPGVKLPARAAAWLTQQRNKFYLDATAVPGTGLRDRMRRLLVEAGLEQRQRMSRPMTEHDVRPAEEPRASAPSALQGSRTSTPMGTWLVTGVGAPLKPPPRRQGVRA